MSYKIVIIGARFGRVWRAISAKHRINLMKEAVDHHKTQIWVIAPELVLVMRPRLHEPKPSTLIHPLDTIQRGWCQGCPLSLSSGLTSSNKYDRLTLTAGSSVVLCGVEFTGIELAAKMSRRLAHVSNARVILVGNADEIGSGFGSSPRSTIIRTLADRSVEVKLGSGVNAVDTEGVTLTSSERRIPGVKDALGRLHVDQYLHVPSVNACTPAGRMSGHNAAADLLGQPLMVFEQPIYNCCLDLGPWGTVIADGWARDNITRYTNQRSIYPPEDAKEALRLGDPVCLIPTSCLNGWFAR
ncbi:hypothetical protein BDW67DRAFT_178698 [Aspergillus spinulosporus]